MGWQLGRNNKSTSTRWNLLLILNRKFMILNDSLQQMLITHLTFMGLCIANIFQYVSNKMQLYSLFICGNCSTCFGCYFRPSSGAHTTVSTTSGICHTITNKTCKVINKLCKVASCWIYIGIC
jgi:hypothetical protein